MKINIYGTMLPIFRSVFFFQAVVLSLDYRGSDQESKIETWKIVRDPSSGAHR